MHVQWVCMHVQGYVPIRALFKANSRIFYYLTHFLLHLPNHHFQLHYTPKQCINPVEIHCKVQVQRYVQVLFIFIHRGGFWGMVWFGVLCLIKMRGEDVIRRDWQLIWGNYCKDWWRSQVGAGKREMTPCVAGRN